MEPPASASHSDTPPDDEVRDLRPLVRLYGSGHAHRLLPARLALALVGALEPPVRHRRNPATRQRVERFMTDLLLYTPRAGEARTLARRYMAEKARQRELVWRPWLLKRSRIIGREHWNAAHSGGRGCVVVIGHMGGTFAVPAILARLEAELYMVTSPHFWEAPPPGWIGMLMVQVRKEYAEKFLGRSHLIPSKASPGRLVELLESGASILIAFDVPGSAATPFLGRSVALGGGPGTLAFRTGAKVLPVIPERHGARIDLRILEPIDPADHRDLRSLRAGIARTFEPFVVANPEMVELTWDPAPLVTEVLSSKASYGDVQPD